MILIVDFSKKPDKERLYNVLKGLKAMPYRVELKENRGKRSLNENAYYWGVVVKILSDYTGDTPDDMHEVLKAKFLKTVVNFGGEELVMSKHTWNLTTKEFEEYLEQIRIFAQTELDVKIPLPNEYLDIKL
jgi:ATP-dependent phosphoenolpyruvate carboxykinase